MNASIMLLLTLKTGFFTYGLNPSATQDPKIHWCPEPVYGEELSDLQICYLVLIEKKKVTRIQSYDSKKSTNLFLLPSNAKLLAKECPYAFETVKRLTRSPYRYKMYSGAVGSLAGTYPKDKRLFEVYDRNGKLICHSTKDLTWVIDN